MLRAEDGSRSVISQCLIGFGLAFARLGVWNELLRSSLGFAFATIGARRETRGQNTKGDDDAGCQFD